MQVGAALLASAEGYTPRANGVLDRAREELGPIAEIANALADNLPAPKAPARRSRRRRKKRKGGASGQAEAAAAPQAVAEEPPAGQEQAPGGDEASASDEPAPPRRRQRRRRVEVVEPSDDGRPDVRAGVQSAAEDAA
jgi:hypothetical protein